MTRSPTPVAPARPVAPRVTGWRHVFAAASYSLGGIARLSKETAFRHEVLALVPCLLLLALVGASPAEMAAMIGLFGLLVAVEALNTAIECIVDQSRRTGRKRRATRRIWGRSR